MPIPHLHEMGMLLVVGLLAGALGGMLGIGGSIIMIPGVALLLGRNQHTAQAAAMIVNIFVAAPSAYRHHQARAVRWDVMIRMLPAAFVFIVLGVGASNLFPGVTLQRMFGVFLIYIIATELLKLVRGTPEELHGPEHVEWWLSGIVGAIMGFAAGLLGIGAGIIAVPLLQRLCGLPFRQSIATSSAAMCLTAIVGAIRKNMTLPQHVIDGVPLDPKDSLMIAACLIPTAMAGSFIGAGLTHALPLKWVRVAFLLLATWSSLEMLGLLNMR